MKNYEEFYSIMMLASDFWDDYIRGMVDLKNSGN